MVHADKPSIFCIHQKQFTVGFLKIRVAQSHIITDGMQIAGTLDFDVALFTCDDVFTHKQAAIRKPMGLLKHFAFTASACAFVHKTHYVVIRCDHLDRGTVCGHPTLMRTNINQSAVNAFFRTGTWVEIVGKYFVYSDAIMDNDLFAAKVCVAEWRRHIKNGRWLYRLFSLLQSAIPCRSPRPKASLALAGQTANAMSPVPGWPISKTKAARL